MHIHYETLQRFFAFDLNPEKLGEILTQLGLEVEKISTQAVGTVLEIGLTPNRADAMSHYGVARDLAAYLYFHRDQQLFTLPQYPSLDHLGAGDLSLEIAPNCLFYAGVSIRVPQNLSSPQWLLDFLSLMEMDSRGLVVDLTNYVMLELGVPLHAFDASVLGKKIQVGSSSHTSFAALNGQNYTLDPNAICIYNATGVHALGGIIGGQAAAYKPTTTEIFVEAAYFEPSAVRKTAKALGIHTEASFRHERGIDPLMIKKALARFVQLLQENAAAQPLHYIEQKNEALLSFHSLSFSLDKATELLGMAISPNAAEKIFQALEMGFKKQANNHYILSIPPYRVDVKRQADVTEEILRLYGFDQIPLPTKMSFSPVFVSAKDPEYQASTWLVDQGFVQTMHLSMSNPQYVEKFWPEAQNRLIRLSNPLSPELSIMRPSLLFSMLETAAYNQNRKNTDVRIFEWGYSYSLNFRQEVNAKKELAILMMGKKHPENWHYPFQKLDFFDLKKYTEGLFSALGIQIPIDHQSSKAQHHGGFFQSALTYSALGSEPMLEMGQVKKDLLAHFDLKLDVFYATIAWDFLPLPTHTPVIGLLPKTLPVRRDLALLLDESISFLQLQKALTYLELPQLKDFFLFDVYQGEHLPVGKKSYAMGFLLQDEHTLEEQQINSMMELILQTLTKECGAVLRR